MSNDRRGAFLKTAHSADAPRTQPPVCPELGGYLTAKTQVVELARLKGRWEQAYENINGTLEALTVFRIPGLTLSQMVFSRSG